MSPCLSDCWARIAARSLLHFNSDLDFFFFLTFFNVVPVVEVDVAPVGTGDNEEGEDMSVLGTTLKNGGKKGEEGTDREGTDNTDEIFA